MSLPKTEIVEKQKKTQISLQIYDLHLCFSILGRGVQIYLQIADDGEQIYDLIP